MKSELRFAVAVGYVWVAMVAFGGILVETIIVYPNVFHDAPASLAGAVEFFVVTGPADLFPPMGALTVLAAVAAVAASWRVRRARMWLGASLASLVLGEFLFSVLYFWPRNDIMFEEGIAVHSAEFLRRTAVEFETGHWVRLAMSGVTAAFAFTGLLRFHRERVATAGTGR
ncbi:MAG: anthrone oxygenase family protein [Pseudonocardia sp.]